MTYVGRTQKAALACGSMVGYVFVYSFSPRRGEKRIDKKKKSVGCVRL
jgi:hypothetical protein